MVIVDRLINGRDGLARAVKMRAARAILHLYPLKLTCDRKTGRHGYEMHPDATEYRECTQGRFFPLNL